MKTVLKTLAGICAVFFLLTGVPALVLFNVERKAFDPESYKQAFEDQRYIERMPGVLANALHTSIAEDGNADSYLKALTVEDWQASISTLLPPEDLQTLTEGTLDSVFGYLNGRTNSAVISIASLKKELSGEAGVLTIKLFLRAQPPCTVEQLLQIGLGLIERGDILLCNPPEEAFGMLAPLIESQLQTMIVNFPDEITLIPGTKSGTPDDPRINLNKLRAVLKITPVLPLIFLIGITILAVRSFPDWLKWWGWPLLVTGATGFIVALIGSPIVGRVVQGVLQTQTSGIMPPILMSTLREAVSAVSRQILKPVALEGILLGILGLGMILVAAYVVKKDGTPLPNK